MAQRFRKVGVRSGGQSAYLQGFTCGCRLTSFLQSRKVLVILCISDTIVNVI